MQEFERYVSGYLPQYISIDDELRMLMKSLPQVKEQNQRIQQLKTQISQQQSEVNRAVLNTTRERTKVEKLKRAGLTSLMAKIQNKRDEKLVKHESAYYSCVSKEKAVKSALSGLELQLADENAVLRDLNAKKDRFHYLKKEMDNLLDQMFRMSYNAYPKDRELQNQRDSLSQRYSEISDYLAQYERCEGCLVEALQLLEKGKSLLESATNMAAVDIYTNRSYMVDTIKYSNLDKSRSAVNAAQQQIIRAVQLVPSLSGTIIAARVTKGDPFIDIFYDNVFTDIIVYQKIRNSLVQVAQSMHSVQQAVDYVRNSLIGIRKDHQNTNQQLTQVRSQLEIARHKIINGLVTRQNNYPYRPNNSPQHQFYGNPNDYSHYRMTT